MREILFRGKRLDNGEWVEGHFVSTNTSAYICYADQYNDDLFLSPENILIEVDPATVGQYTGLNDKHERKIFEGDVLDYAHPFRNRTGQYAVEWEADGFGCKGFYQSHYDYPTAAFSEGTQYFEVICNIHDNPELLEATPCTE